MKSIYYNEIHNREGTYSDIACSRNENVTTKGALEVPLAIVLAIVATTRRYEPGSGSLDPVAPAIVLHRRRRSSGSSSQTRSRFSELFQLDRERQTLVSNLEAVTRARPFFSPSGLSDFSNVTTSRRITEAQFTTGGGNR